MADTERFDGVAAREAKKAGEARPWLAMITAAQKQYQDYQDRAENIERIYADLSRLASDTRDKQFQLFWANIQVLGPSIYSRPPVPVVVPRFKDRRPLVRMASELLERATVVQFESEDVDYVMRLARDDLNVTGRGVLWCRYETKADGDDDEERVCVEHVSRRDFLHDPARKWSEVDWVAKRSWLTREQVKKRFKDRTADEVDALAYNVLKDEDGGDNGQLKAPIWELWSKSENKVVWVSEGCEHTLDEDEPHLTLEGFFPCPRPAYATVQANSLVPVPDMAFYKDQLDEINDLTARISSLADAIKVRGFYPAGLGEVSDAIEAAVKSVDDRSVLIPVSNWNALGGASAKDMIVWWPIESVVQAITQLVEIRKQLIDDVYQIMGLSDIMRGSTEASETLGAQQLKSQYGSVRIRDKQAELVRIARDVTRIVAEVMAENFDQKTLLEMSQLELPKKAEIAKQVKAIEAQAKDIQAKAAQAQQDPQVVAMAQQDPEQAKQIADQAQQQLQQLGQQAEQLEKTVTIEAVMDFLRDQRLRPFTLDIETDSTVAPDENAQKQRAVEFVTAIGGAMNQAAPLLMQIPQAGPLLAESLKFLAGQFRAGRPLEQEIEEFADSIKDMAKQPKPPNPEQQKAQMEQQAAAAKMQIDQVTAQAEAAKKHAEAEALAIESQAKMQDLQSRAAEEQHKQALRMQELEAKAREAAIRQANLANDDARAQTKHERELELRDLEAQHKRTEIDHLNMKTNAMLATTSAGIAAKTAAQGVE